jgi:hypothetical protein
MAFHLVSQINSFEIILIFGVKNHSFSRYISIESVQSQLAEIITKGILFSDKNLKKSFTHSLNSINLLSIILCISFLCNPDATSKSRCLFHQIVISCFFVSKSIFGSISIGL